ncbi:hypothetical protein GCM10027590_35640 [Nocardiopsis nanhaiensis]
MDDHDGRGRDDPGKIDPARCRGGGGRHRRWAAHGGLIDTHISYRYHFVIFGFNPIRGSETNATRVCTVLTQERTAATLAAARGEHGSPHDSTGRSRQDTTPGPEVA